jgi:lysozyme
VLNRLRASEACIVSLKVSEGFKSVAYWDQYGCCWTCGYGETEGVVRGLRWTEAEADARLRKRIAYFEGIVNDHVTTHLTQDQFDALVHFVYNVGPGAKGVKDGFVTLKSGQMSTMLRALNAGNFRMAADEFPKWNRSGGQVLPGLVSRRKHERTWFLAGTAAA